MPIMSYVFFPRATTGTFLTSPFSFSECILHVSSIFSTLWRDGVCWVAGREWKGRWKALLVAQFKSIVYAAEYH